MLREKKSPVAPGGHETKEVKHMQTYKYTAMTQEGARVSGVVEGVDEYAAVERIRLQYPIVLKIQEVKAPSRQLAFLSQDISRGIDTKALSVMCSQFSIMLRSGLTIAACAEMIAGQTKDRRLRLMLEKSAQDIAQGVPASDAFEKNCQELPVTFIETVRAGELSGTLEDSFAMLESYYEKDYKSKQKIKQALSYPIFVVCVAIVVLLVVMIKVMPTITSVFADLGGELPAMTRVMIAMSEFFGTWWLLILGIIGAAAVLVKIYHHTPKGRVHWAKRKLTMPVLGNINTLNGSTQFANTMATLLKAGLPVSSALEVTSKVEENYILAKEIGGMVEKVESGHTLGECMKDCAYLPQVLKQMTGIGEETGELESTLEVIGGYYQNELDFAMKSAISKLEPTMLIILAIFAGFIVISIYLPMFTMYNLM